MHFSLRAVSLVLFLSLFAITTSFLQATTVNGVLYASDFPGNDLGAQVMAAISTCSSGCTILLPKGRFDVSTPIVLRTGVTLVGQGTGATALNWVGSSNVAPIEIRYAMRSRLQGFALNRNNSTTMAPAIEVFGGWDTRIDDIWCTANWGVWQEYVGFQGCVWITGTDQAPSCLTRLTNSRLENYAGYSVKVDHAVDTYFVSLSSYSYPGNTTADGLVIDTAVGGFHADMFSCGRGKHCLVVQNTLGGTVPHWLYFNEFEADTTTGGDGILFDKSLGKDPVATVFTSSWSGGAGLNDTGGIITPSANGIRIAGGSSITWEGRIRRNAANGVLISSNTSSFITLHNSQIYANNLANSGDGHGIYISGATTHISISDNDITNSLDYGGQQRYGIKVGRVRADQLRIVNNDLTNNVTASLLNNDVGASMISGNMPLSSSTQAGTGAGSPSQATTAPPSKGTSVGTPYPVTGRGCIRGVEC
ncbi:MAG: right-handed parallel beta-helix repeat-containing protein [Candidatus Korobacteraceae bacterium]